MKATQLLPNLGQSFWLDNITRDLLNNGKLERYRDEFSVTGLTSNPVNTIPESTLKAFAEHGEADRVMAADGMAAEKSLTQFAQAGVDVNGLAARLQDEGAKSFVKSWNDLLAVIEFKCGALKQTA